MQAIETDPLNRRAGITIDNMTAPRAGTAQAAMAAFAGIIDVAQELSRSYLADGQIDAEEINKSFGKIADKTDKKG